MNQIPRWITSWWCLFIAILFTQNIAAAQEPLQQQKDHNIALESELPDIGQRSVYQKISQHLQFTLVLNTGVRFDQVEWNIAASAAGTPPNILSELTWSDVLSHQLSAGGRVQVGNSFYGRGHVNYAWIQNGTVRDSDYGGNDRTQEWSRSISETNGDQLWDVVAGGGYPFAFRQKRLLMVPLLGISIHKQNLRITNGRQIVSAAPPPGYRPPPDVGPLDSQLNSIYKTQWKSVWIGCDLRYQAVAAPGSSPPMAWGISFAYHFWADYSAEADWNLRADLQHPVSFKHDADAQGISMQAEWQLRMTNHLNLCLNLNYTRWLTDRGLDTVYSVDGSAQVTRLNEVIWESKSVMVGATYRLF